MLLAPVLGEKPRDVAARLGEAVSSRLGDQVVKVDIAGPGFLNLFLSDAWYADALAGVLAAGDGYGGGGAGAAGAEDHEEDGVPHPHRPPRPRPPRHARPTRGDTQAVRLPPHPGPP